MIKTKIIVKPKDGSSSSGSVTEGSYGSGYADYAASAGRSKQSDRSALATLAETAISAYRAKRADMASELDPDSETLQGYVLKEWFGKLLSVVDVDGTEQDINGTVGDGMKIMPHLGLTSIDVSGDGHISLGGMQMVYDAAHGAWRLDGSLYVTGGLSALGNSDVAGGGCGGLMGTIVPYAKAITLTTQNEGAEIASAWSVKMLYDKIETIDVSGQLTSYLTKQEAQSLYQPVGNYLTEQDISGKADRSELSQYLPLSGGTLNGLLTIEPTNVSGHQIGLRLHDSGGGGYEGLMIQWTSTSYLDGVSLLGRPDSQSLQFINSSGNYYTVWHTGNLINVSQLTNDSGYVTSSIVNGYATQSWVNTQLGNYLPLTGGTMTGNLNLGSNTLFAQNLSLTNEIDNWNFNRADNRLRFLISRDKAAIGAQGVYLSGISAITNYVGFQLVSHGGGDEELYFRKLEDNNIWHDWYRIYHEGFKPTKSDVGLGNVDNTADANKSVSYASTAGSANNADMVDGFHADSFMVFNDSTNYVNCDFVNGNIAEKAKSTYIEFYQGGWMNFFVGNLYAANGVSVYYNDSLRNVIHEGNIGSQSVNYANSAGSVAWSNVNGRPTRLSEFTDDVVSGKYLSLQGGAVNGNVRFNGVVSAGEYIDDKYGIYSCTRPNNGDYCCYSFIRSGIFAFGLGYDSSNNIILGEPKSNEGKSWEGKWLTIGISATMANNFVANNSIQCNGQGSFNSLQIGNITIIYDEANKGLRIAGGGLYTDSYLSSLGVDASTALSVKKWADSINLTEESDSELATAYSIGNLYRLINSNQESITQSLNQSVSALQGRCTSLEQRVSALENKVNK